MTSSTLTLAALLLTWGFGSQGANGTTQPQGSRPEAFSAIYANISNVGQVGAAPITIRITRWTDAGEHEKLMSVLESKGTEGLVRELQDGKSTGSIGTPQELPYELRYARQYPTEGGGRRIILMTDRPMAFAERLSGGRSRDYPLTWIELRLDANGRGEGSVSLAARLQLLGDILGIEDYANQPAKLNEVRPIK
ncbi:MAG: hypothetical protein ABIS06_09760 [Vicinamibacterales bacterium]